MRNRNWRKGMSTRDPHCPHCDAYVSYTVINEAQLPPIEIVEDVLSDHNAVVTCDDCGKDFGLTRSVLLTVTYETKKETTR